MAETEKIELSQLDGEHPQMVLKVYRFLVDCSLYMVRSYPLDRSAAEDCAQTVVVKLLRMSVEQRANVTFPPSYLRSAVRNTIIDRLKRENPSRESSLDDEAVVYELPDPAQEDKKHESGIMLSKVWNMLDTDDEKKLMKMYLFGYKDPEIAKILGTNEEDVRAMHAQLRYKLKKIIGKIKTAERS
jgi:RNA polymerase sigma factor (sigma-70 family)